MDDAQSAFRRRRPPSLLREVASGILCLICQWQHSSLLLSHTEGEWWQGFSVVAVSAATVEVRDLGEDSGFALVAFDFAQGAHDDPLAALGRRFVIACGITIVPVGLAEHYHRVLLVPL